MRKNDANGKTGTAKPKLSLAGRREVPPELIEKATWRLMQEDLSQFASDIDTAREFWRSRREMVEAPEMPAHLEALVNIAHFGALGTDEMADVREKLMADPRLVKIVNEAREEVDPSLVEDHARRLMRTA